MIDFKFIIDKHILGNRGGWRYRRNYERAVRKKALSIHGRLFIDIGAHKLYYSNLLAENFNSVWAFEPNKNLNVSEGTQDNIHVFTIAISDHNGTETFYCYNNEGGDSLVKDFEYHVTGRNYEPDKHGSFGHLIDSFPVKVQTFDEAVGMIADLVKIDVEGAEFKVLAGMNRFPPKNLIVEIHDQREEKDLVKVLEKKGYRVNYLDSNHLFGELL